MKKQITNIICTFLIIAVSGILLVSGPANIKAQTDNITRIPTTQEVTEVRTEEYTGRITRIENRSLILDTQSGSRSVNVPQNLRITKDNNSSNFESLAVNDEVTVKVDQSGQVLDLFATSASAADTSKLLVPGLVLLLLGLLAAYILARRANKGHIKTTTTQVS